MKKGTIIISLSVILFVSIIINDLKVLIAESKKKNEQIQSGPVCFNRDILPIFNQYCARSGCHDRNSHAEGLILDSYSNLISLVNPGQPDDSELYLKMTVDDEKMPPSNYPQPSQNQINLIRTWITEGANETDCQNDPCDSSNVTFSTVIKPIIQNNCIGCHSGSQPEGGISFSSDASIENMKIRIYGAIAHINGYVAMPPSINFYNCYKSQIRIWALEESSQPCDTSNVSFSSVIKPIIQRQCVTCHSGSNPSGGIDLTNDNVINSNKTKIYGAVAGLNGYIGMPPGMKISSCSIAKIRIWAIPNTSGPCDTSNVTFATTIKPILENYCLSCHSGSNPSGGLNFSVDNVVETNKTRIFGAVAGLSGYSPMPPAIRIDSCSIAKIRIWAYPNTNEPCDTNNVTFLGTIKQVIQLHCISCHSGNNAPSGLDFSNENLVKASKSRIYGSIAGIAGYKSMPPSITLDTCSSKKFKIWAGTSDIQPCDTSNITFNQTIKPILQTQCVSCHSGTQSPLGLDFTQDSLVDRNKMRIFASVSRITGYTPMPPSINLDSCLIKQIRIWANKTENKPCDTTNVTFEGTIKPILQSSCISCHSGANSPMGLDFTNDSITLMNKSRILGSVAKISGYKPMPPGLSLDTCSLKQIKIWASKVDDKPCDTLNVTYMGTIKKIITTQCISCHSGNNPPLGLNFSDDSFVENIKSRIYGSVANIVGYTSMPPSQKLDSCSVKQIKIWNSLQRMKNCDTSNITFEGEIKPIIKYNCEGCHKSPDPPRGLDFTNDNNIINSRKTIYASVAHLNGYIEMPPAIMLDSCLLLKLKIWSSAKDSLPCDTTDFSYKKKIKPILEGNCTSCHSGGEYAPNGLDFEVDSISEKNKLLINCAVNHFDGCSIMPPSDEKLDSCSLFLINLWSNLPTSVEDNTNLKNINLILYPNPSEQILNIKYFLPEQNIIVLEIYNAKGKILYENNLNNQPAGFHNERIELDGLLPSCSYIVRLKAGNKYYDKSFRHL